MSVRLPSCATACLPGACCAPAFLLACCLPARCPASLPCLFSCFLACFLSACFLACASVCRPAGLLGYGPWSCFTRWNAESRARRRTAGAVRRECCSEVDFHLLEEGDQKRQFHALSTRSEGIDPRIHHGRGCAEIDPRTRAQALKPSLVFSSVLAGGV